MFGTIKLVRQNVAFFSNLSKKKKKKILPIQTYIRIEWTVHLSNDQC